MNAYDCSGNSRYTITICNDRSIGNSHGQGDYIHTWLVVTDKYGGPGGTEFKYALSYTCETHSLIGPSAFDIPSSTRLTGGIRSTEEITLL